MKVYLIFSRMIRFHKWKSVEPTTNRRNNIYRYLPVSREEEKVSVTMNSSFFRAPSWAIAVLAAIAAPGRSQSPAPIELQSVEQTAQEMGLTIPTGVTTLRLALAPLEDSGESVLLHFYQRRESVFVDLLTSRQNQPWLRRNHLRLQGSSAAQPARSILTLRRLEPERRRGWFLMATGNTFHWALSLPRGFGGPAFQQGFLKSVASNHQRSYDFTQLDSRGFVIVKVNVENAGDAQPGPDSVFYVWNGRQFVQRPGN